MNSHVGMLIDRLKITWERQFGNLTMKTLNQIAIIIFIWSTIGCSSLGGWIPPIPVSQDVNGVVSLSPLHPELAHNTSKSFDVFNMNPYAINLEFDESGTDPMRIPARGDGGASLNAYAACLTLKVMF